MLGIVSPDPLWHDDAAMLARERGRLALRAGAHRDDATKGTARTAASRGDAAGAGKATAAKAAVVSSAEGDGATGKAGNADAAATWQQHCSSTATDGDVDDGCSALSGSTTATSSQPPSEPTFPVRWAARPPAQADDDAGNAGAPEAPPRTRFGRRSHDLAYGKRNVTFAEFLAEYNDPAGNATLYAAQLDVATHLPSLPVPALPDAVVASVGPPSASSAPVTVYWSGAGAPVTQLHYDSRDNVVCVVSGEFKTFRLVDPVQSAALLYSHADRDGNTSPVPIDDAGAVAAGYPLARFAAVAVATLRAGDCLFVPVYWFHQVESAPSRTVSVNYWREPAAKRKNVVGRLLCGHVNRKAAKRC